MMNTVSNRCFRIKVIGLSTVERFDFADFTEGYSLTAGLSLNVCWTLAAASLSGIIAQNAG